MKIYIEEDDEERDIRLVTTLRQNAPRASSARSPPVGRAVMGHRAGDRVLVEVSPDYSYYIVIRSVEKGEDDGSIPIRGY